MIRMMNTKTAMAAFAFTLTALDAFGTDGTWINTAGGNWSTQGNWSGGTIANGTGATAAFNTLNLTSPATVTMDSSRTVGKIFFADTTPSSHTWTLNGSASKYLTLASSSGSPTVDVINTEVFLGGFQGAGGLVKSGNGVLALFGKTYGNALTGPIIVNGGVLGTVNGKALQYVTGDITVAAGATFEANFGNDYTACYNNYYLSGTGGTPSGYFTASTPDGGTYGGSPSMGALELRGSAIINGSITLVTHSKITHSYNDSRINGTVTANAPGKNLELAITVAGQWGLPVNGTLNLGTGTLTINSVQNGGSNGASTSLNTSNTYSGGTVLTNYAVLRLGHAGALGSGGITLYPNTSLNLNAFSISLPFLTGSGGLITDTNGVAGTTLLTVTQSVATVYAGTIKDGPSRVITLVKSGSGSLTLSGINTYSGATLVTGGRLLGATGGSCTNSTFTVSDGATNGVQVSAFNGQWACAGLTYNAGTTALAFDFGTVSPSHSLAPLHVSGDLSVAGSVLIRVNNGVWPATGTYPLLSYAGTLTGTGSFSLADLPPGIVATLVNNTEAKRLDLNVTVVSAVAPPVNEWTCLVSGNASGTWGAGSNWSPATVPNAIDSVADFSTLNITAYSTVSNDSPRTIGCLLFSDTTPSYHSWTLDGGADRQLTLATSVGVPSITVNDTTAFLGGFKGTGGLVKNGNGMLALYGKNYANVLSGPITVNGGLLGTVNGKAFKYITGDIIVSEGASFEANFANDFSLCYNNFYLSGTGGASSGYLNANPSTPDGNYFSTPLPMGALEINRSAKLYGTITLVTDSKITHGHNDSQISGSIIATTPGKNLELAVTTSGGYGLSIYGNMDLGTGTLTVNSVMNGGSGNGFSILLNAANRYSGGTVLTNYASLRIGNSEALGSGGVTLSPNACLNLYGFNVSIPFLSGTGGTVTDTNGTAGVTTLALNQSVSTTYAGVISDGPNRALSLVKNGPGSLTLTGTNTYSGTTVVSNGTLGVSGALGSGAVTFCAGSAFAAGGPGVVGNAMLGGTLTFETGSAVWVDVANTGADTVSVSGNVTAGTGIEVHLDGDREQAGCWKIIESSGTLQGGFFLIGGLHGAHLTQTANAVWLTIPPRGTLLFVH